MTALAAPTGRTLAALEVGDAMAVLVPCDGLGSQGRDFAATRTLHRVTGRSDICISRRPSGRPRLLPPYPELGVSLSSRSGWLLAGFSPGAPVGVDLESAASLRPADAARLAGDHFAAGEATAIGTLAPAAADDLFMRLWVAKEALLKTTGRGVFDGVAEPDLSGVIDMLEPEDAHVELRAGGWRGHKIAVRRIEAAVLAGNADTQPGSARHGTMYLALARAPG